MAPERLKGIVLCAGRGARLQPLTDDRPKCLIEFDGRVLLGLCLDSFRASGIEEIVLVTGYKRELVERFVAERGERGLTFVTNERYAETNTAYSLNLALRVMDAGFVLANGDVLFDRTILRDLIACPVPNCVAVDTDIPLDAEEVKVIVRDGRVSDIGKDLDPSRSLGEAIGLYKIHHGLVEDLRRIYDELESRSELHHYFEKGFERICAENGGGPRSFGIAPTLRRPWVEIDTREDFVHAQREVFPRIRG
jgi:choline kinase